MSLPVRTPLVTLLLLAACAPAAPPPNVLLITLDTTRSDALGSYGSTTGATPHLDRMAAEGVRFDRAYTVTPLTIPAHSSIHTGLYPPRHGVRDNGDFFLGDDATTLAERLSGAGYATMASVGAEVTSHHWGFAQGFGTFYDDMGPASAAPDGGANRWRVERAGEKVVDDALSWLDANGKGDKPWFAWVHMFDVHHPYEPVEPYATMFDGRPYVGEVASVDAQFARLRKWLAENEQLDDTWIFVVADHGEGMGSHGETLHGVLLYDATTHIPFLVRPPRAAGSKAADSSAPGAGRVVSTPVSLVDLAPTILAAVGLPVPAGLDGIDLGPGLVGDLPGGAERAVYAESQYAWHHYGWAPQKVLVTNDHKLLESTTPELYAREDVREKADLAASEPALLTTIRDRLGGMVAAMEPAAGATRADMSPERVAQLEALGYLTTTTAEGPVTDGLPDPVKQLPVLAKLEKARRAFREGDVAVARVAVEEALAADPGLVETRILSANLLWREGKLDEAYAAMAALEAERPSSQSKAMMGSIKLQLGAPAEAANLLREALAIDPYLANAWTAYLHALVLSNDPSLSAEAARARSHLPDSAVAIGITGVAHAMQGRFGPAELLLNDALQRDPNQPFVNHALGLTLRAKGEPLQAEAFFEEEVRLFPPAVASRRILVEIYASQKRYEEQLAQLTTLRDREAPNPETLHSIAQALFNLKRYPESVAVVDECRLLAPRYAGCALLEANVLKKLGRDAEAQVAYDLAVDLAKNP
ncbi:MAG: sulfatase-like hydrolase/transferase [Pseudomonadota bacterium]|nr:sulfatase-like hydrolase/transferase [Pseudomonadota bacterium]